MEILLFFSALFQFFFSFHKWITYEIILEHKEQVLINSHSNLYFNFLSFLLLVFLLLAYKKKKKEFKLVFILEIFILLFLLISLKYPNLFHVSFKTPEDYIFNYNFHFFIFFSVVSLLSTLFVLKNAK